MYVYELANLRIMIILWLLVPQLIKLIDGAWNVHDFVFVKVLLAMKFVKCLSNENYQLYSNIFESVAIQE